MIKRIAYFILFAALIWSLFFGLGDIILFGKSVVIRVLIFALIFVGVPFALFRFLSTFKIKADVLVNKVLPLSILILGPAFGLWANHVSKNDFKEFGRTTYGRILTRELSSSKRTGGWIVSGEFRYQSKTYKTFAKSEKEHHYKIGETVLVRFSTRNPENNELILK
nr:hypothetical protein [uncultured Fluviicola sp.]